jgi:hypothetical protein
VIAVQHERGHGPLQEILRTAGFFLLLGVVFLFLLLPPWGCCLGGSALAYLGLGKDLGENLLFFLVRLFSFLLLMFGSRDIDEVEGSLRSSGDS